MRTSRLRRLLLIALVGVWIGGLDPVGAAPAPVPRAILCEDVCGGGGASCDDECWLTQFEYDQSYPPTSCGAESYSCCGDEICDAPVEGCSSAVCEDDCGDMPTCPEECPCESPYVCNGSLECVLPESEVEIPGGTCGGECTSNSQCCGNDLCQGAPGLGYCAIPSTSYCEEAPSCNDSQDCDTWADNFCQSQNHAIMFCDPGIGRCQFLDNPACPSESNICFF